MNLRIETLASIAITGALTALTLGSVSHAAQQPESWDQRALDSCESDDNTADTGTSWQPSLDTERGGTSTIEWSSTKGRFGASGVIEPVPGSMGPGTAGMLLPLGEDGAEFDLSGWDGISVTIRRSGAPLLLRIHSTEIENGDHFATVIPENSRFETYQFSFRQLGQVMSAQQPWSGTRVTGIELVAFGWSSSEFAWEIEDISFYRDEPAKDPGGRMDG